jgi:hypothetical protein
MRKPGLDLSPLQTIALSILGALIASAGFVLPVPHHNGHDSPLWLLAAMLALVIAGFAVSFYASTDLESGLSNERWPEDEITSTRALLGSSLVTGAALLCVIAAMVLMLIARSTRPSGWALLVFGQSLTRLQTAAKPPRPNRSASSFTTNWNSFSPIHSDHWGER